MVRNISFTLKLLTKLIKSNVDIRLSATVELIRLSANLALNDGETINHWLFHNHLGQGWRLNEVALKRMSTLHAVFFLLYITYKNLIYYTSEKVPSTANEAKNTLKRAN